MDADHVQVALKGKIIHLHSKNICTIALILLENFHFLAAAALRERGRPRAPAAAHNVPRANTRRWGLDASIVPPASTPRQRARRNAPRAARASTRRRLQPHQQPRAQCLDNSSPRR